MTSLGVRIKKITYTIFYVDNGDKSDIETCIEVGTRKIYKFMLKLVTFVVAIDYSMQCQVHNRN